LGLTQRVKRLTDVSAAVTNLRASKLYPFRLYGGAGFLLPKF
jgi:hypothetical protein